MREANVVFVAGYSAGIGLAKAQAAAAVGVTVTFLGVLSQALASAAQALGSVPTMGRAGVASTSSSHH
jgi:NADP-dependent 3-hydroxy acid dehydrogenase YdfG